MRDSIQCVHSTEMARTTLEQNHRQPGFRRCERREQPSGAGTDHHDRVRLVCC